MTVPRRTASCALALALALCATLAGCAGGQSGSSHGRVNLRFAWWGNPDRATRTQKAVALFEKRHPDISITTSYAEYGTYGQKLATEAAGGDAPDVMQLDYRQIDQYATAGVLLDLGARHDVHTSHIDRSQLVTGVVDHHLYAIPMGRGAEAMPYDASLWRKVGLRTPSVHWTWDDWAHAMRVLAKQSPGKAGGTDPGWNEDNFEVWLRGQGKSLYRPHRKLGFTAHDLARFWQLCTTLRKAGAVSTAEQTTQMDGAVENSPLGRGTAASDFTWDAAAAGYGAVLGDRLKLAPMPAGPDGTPGEYYKPSMFIAAAANTGHPKQAAEFIDFMMNDRQAGAILGATRGIPVNDRIRAQESPRLKDFDRVMDTFQRRFGNTLHDPPAAPPRGDAALQTTFQRDYEQVSFQRTSALAAAQEYVTEAKAELSQ